MSAFASGASIAEGMETAKRIAKNLKTTIDGMEPGARVPVLTFYRNNHMLVKHGDIIKTEEGGKNLIYNQDDGYYYLEGTQYADGKPYAVEDYIVDAFDVMTGGARRHSKRKTHRRSRKSHRRRRQSRRDRR